MIIISPIYLLFFVISGASLDLTIFFERSGLIVLVIAAIYIVFRVAGKYTGARVGSRISHAEPQVQKYLGLALVPQAGVAIGLTIVAGRVVPDYASSIKAVVLCATLIYELIGPVLAKIALKKANEIENNNSEVKASV